MNSHLENHKKFLEELTDKKNRTSEEKVKNLFEKVYSQDTVCQEEREENTEKFDQLTLVMKNIEHKFESEVGNVEEKFKSSIAIVLEELQGSISKVTDRQNRYIIQSFSYFRITFKVEALFSTDEKLAEIEKVSKSTSKILQSVSEKEQNLSEMKDKFTELSNSVLTFQDKIESSASMIENIEEKMYDFEIGKKNNLILYGIPAPKNETRHSLASAVQAWVDILPRNPFFYLLDNWIF